MSTSQNPVLPPLGDASGGLAGDVRESIAISSLNSVAGQTSVLSNLVYANTGQSVNQSQQNAVANQQAMNAIGGSVTGRVTNLVSNLSPREAVAVVKLTSGNDLAEQIADLRASLAPLTPPTPPDPQVVEVTPPVTIVVREPKTGR